jgi:hypothetical protein
MNPQLTLAVARAHQDDLRRHTAAAREAEPRRRARGSGSGLLGMLSLTGGIGRGRLAAAGTGGATTAS